MKSGVGASFDRPCFTSEKQGCGIGNASELPFDEDSDVRDREGEFKGESDPNDDTDEEAERVSPEPSRLDALLDFLEPPTGKRVMGRSDDSRR
jgi:hypothetical protein